MDGGARSDGVRSMRTRRVGELESRFRKMKMMWWKKKRRERSMRTRRN